MRKMNAGDVAITQVGPPVRWQQASQSLVILLRLSPGCYVQERRVERAKELLRQSDLPITEIADRIGCSSHSHFSVLFNRVTGLTPRSFARSPDPFS
jgi:methylphosphotriester-DNA--protein-cysteine methyltransferase